MRVPIRTKRGLSRLTVAVMPRCAPGNPSNAAISELSDPALEPGGRQNKELKRSGEARPFPLVRGTLRAGAVVLPCALGRAGIRHAKREGDHATPAGKFRLLGGYYRPDRVTRQAWPLQLSRMKPGDGWCDDPASACYNRAMRLPFGAGREVLWRCDRIYDLIVVLDYNIRPRRRSRGSAIFLHCARPDFAPTEGCIALAFDDFRRLLPRLSRNTGLIIR
jgi:L,D-peptidoglycan transpeptidase YkuD (ErfK/YbiS/YcfS/YnhG family)